MSDPKTVVDPEASPATEDTATKKEEDAVLDDAALAQVAGGTGGQRDGIKGEGKPITAVEHKH